MALETRGLMAKTMDRAMDRVGAIQARVVLQGDLLHHFGLLGQIEVMVRVEAIRVRVVLISIFKV